MDFLLTLHLAIKMVTPWVGAMEFFNPAREMCIPCHHKIIEYTDALMISEP